MLDRGHLAEGRQVPQLDCPVVTGRGECLAAWRECHPKDPFLMGLKGSDFLPGDSIPERGIYAACDQRLAVRGKGGSEHIINGNNAYALYDMMKDLRNGLWSELRSGKSIDIYRRNLQRAYIDRMEYLMTKEQPELSANARRFSSATEVDVDQSDIRAITRAELISLQSAIRSAIGNTGDTMTRIHLRDILERIDNILNPNG